MDATAMTSAKQNIRQLKKQKAEINAAQPDRKKVRRLQRKIRLLKRTTRELAAQKKAEAAKAAAETKPAEASA